MLGPPFLFCLTYLRSLSVHFQYLKVVHHLRASHRHPICNFNTKWIGCENGRLMELAQALVLAGLNLRVPLTLYDFIWKQRHHFKTALNSRHRNDFQKNNNAIRKNFLLAASEPVSHFKHYRTTALVTELLEDNKRLYSENQHNPLAFMSSGGSSRAIYFGPNEGALTFTFRVQESENGETFIYQGTMIINTVATVLQFLIHIFQGFSLLFCIRHWSR
jgi:hypothetical protein